MFNLAMTFVATFLIFNNQAFAKVLIVISSADTLTLEFSTVPTGYNPMELLEITNQLDAYKIDYDIATPTGQIPKIDVNYMNTSQWNKYQLPSATVNQALLETYLNYGNGQSTKKSFKMLSGLSKLEDIFGRLSFSDLAPGSGQKAEDFLNWYKEYQAHQTSHNEATHLTFKIRDLKNLAVQSSTYEGLFIPGGHSVVTDLPDDEDLGEILVNFHDRQIPIATICHGSLALLSAQIHSESAFKDYKVTVTNRVEEFGFEYFLYFNTSLFKPRNRLLPHPIDRLESAGFIVATRFPSGSHVIEHEEVITGQNGASSFNLASQFIHKILRNREVR